MDSRSQPAPPVWQLHAAQPRPTVCSTRRGFHVTHGRITAADHRPDQTRQTPISSGPEIRHRNRPDQGVSQRRVDTRSQPYVQRSRPRNLTLSDRIAQSQLRRASRAPQARPSIQSPLLPALPGQLSATSICLHQILCCSSSLTLRNEVTATLRDARALTSRAQERRRGSQRRRACQRAT